MNPGNEAPYQEVNSEAPSKRKRSKKKKSTDDIEPNKRCRANIPLTDKMKILNDLLKGMKKADLARLYNISHGAVTYIFTRKDAIIEEYSKIYPEIEPTVTVDEALFNWFEIKSSSNIYITESKLKKKAFSLAEELKQENFQYSPEWLSNFCITHNIVQNTNENCEVPTEFLWNNLKKDYRESEIYVLNSFPLQIYLDKKKESLNGLSSNGLVSILVSNNITGSDKNKLVIVTNNSTWTELKQVQSLPVFLYLRNNPLISKDILENYLVSWNRDLEQLDKSVVLLVDDHPVFSNISELKHIKIVSYSFKNSHIQKMINKIRNCFEFHYRRKQLLCNKISISSIETVRIISSSWTSVSAGCINRAFHPAPPWTLSFDTKSNEQIRHEENDLNSLSVWYSLHQVPITIDNPSKLDDFLHTEYNMDSYTNEYCTELDPNSTELGSSSAMCAYDAIRRLSRYVQSFHPSKTISKAISKLEMCVESYALKEVCELVDANEASDSKGQK